MDGGNRMQKITTLTDTALPGSSAGHEIRAHSAVRKESLRDTL